MVCDTAATLALRKVGWTIAASGAIVGGGIARGDGAGDLRRGAPGGESLPGRRVDRDVHFVGVAGDRVLVIGIEIDHHAHHVFTVLRDAEVGHAAARHVIVEPRWRDAVCAPLKSRTTRDGSAREKSWMLTDFVDGDHDLGASRQPRRRQSDLTSPLFVSPVVVAWATFARAASAKTVIPTSVQTRLIASSLSLYR